VETKILLPSSFSATELQTFCQDFCDRSPPQKVVILRQYGLERYSQLLCQLIPSPGNLRCLGKFFTQPERMKFPQLQGTDLVGLDLSKTNLIRANFTEANLQGCNLQGADIIFGNFTRANLIQANLQGCTLNETWWQDAIVTDCLFFGSKGIPPWQQQVLLTTGAIFAN
jgi:Pentapeptide repeats (8 copies)